VPHCRSCKPLIPRLNRCSSRGNPAQSWSLPQCGQQIGFLQHSSLSRHFGACPGACRNKYRLAAHSENRCCKCGVWDKGSCANAFQQSGGKINGRITRANQHSIEPHYTFNGDLSSITRMAFLALPDSCTRTCFCAREKACLQPANLAVHKLQPNRH